MSDRRHRQSRATLPEGYQFGDARPSEKRYLFDQLFGITCGGCWREMTYDRLYRAWTCVGCGVRAYPAKNDEQHRSYSRIADICENSWRAPHENAAAQLKRRQQASLACGDEGVAHWFEGQSEHFSPDRRCICGARTWAEEYARLNGRQQLTTARVNDEVNSLVAAHLRGDAIAREMFDTFESQRTGDETI